MRHFVKVLKLDIKKMAQAGQNTIRGVADFSIGKDFSASAEELDCLPTARVAVQEEGQCQTWVSLDTDAKLVRMAYAEEAAVEYQIMERSDDLEITFYVDTCKLRAAWLKATGLLYTSFATRAQAEDPRFSDKVFARHLHMNVESFQEIVACKCKPESISALTLKQIENFARTLRANEFAELTAAILGAHNRKRGTPASATQGTQEGEAMQTPTAEEDDATDQQKKKQARLTFNAEEKKWLNENIGKRIIACQAASSDDRAMIVEEVLNEAKDNITLRSVGWSLSTICNQFKNFRANKRS